MKRIRREGGKTYEAVELQDPVAILSKGTLRDTQNYDQPGHLYQDPLPSSISLQSYARSIPPKLPTMARSAVVGVLGAHAQYRKDSNYSDWWKSQLLPEET